MSKFNDGFGGDSNVKSNLLFNACRESMLCSILLCNFMLLLNKSI